MRTLETRKGLRSLLTLLKVKGKTIAAYGAPAKGNTLLNFCNRYEPAGFRGR